MMKLKHVESKSYKTEDGVIWASRSVAVAGVIFVKTAYNNELFVLLTKRSMDMVDEPGKWCLPCGFLDWNETVSEGTNREIIEETGFDVELHKEYLSYEIPMFKIDDAPTSNRQNITFSSLKMYGDLTEFPFILDKTKESDANRWVSIHSLNTYDLAFNHIDTILKALVYIKLP